MKGDKVPIMLGLCNPLLDISAYVDEDILKKYNLKPNNVILAGDEHKNLCKELVEKYQVEYTAGGSAQNVMRVASGIMRRQKVESKILFTGCICDDDFGRMMSKKAKEDGVLANYAITNEEPTGTCAVLLSDKGKSRSLCAFLGASQKFTEKHLLDNWDQLVAQTDIIYISGFLIAVSPESFHVLGRHVAESNNCGKRFCLNLSAPYVSQVFGEQLDKVMPYVDIVFGNDDEALAFAQFKKWDTTDVETIAAKICKLDKLRSQVGRLVVVTQGERPIVVVQSFEDGSTRSELYPCKQVEPEDMVDTNGAGDSFAGGFLSQFIQKAPLDFCIEMGSYAAREIIKVSGIALPDFSDLPVHNC